MNENINLTKILKDCPKGVELYSPMCGIVLILKVYTDDIVYPIRGIDYKGTCINFTKEGHYYANCQDTECLLFPSKDQRDWSKFTAPWYKKEESIKPKCKVGDIIRHKETNKDDVYEISKVYDDSYGIVGFNWMICMKYQDQYELVHNKFDPKTLKPFDKVLVKEHCNCVWKCNLFSYIIGTKKCYPCRCISGVYKYCIPYNDDTKYLVGTTEEEPEYYRYWED